MLRGVPHLPAVPVRFVARVRTNLVFYQAPPPREPGQKGAARKDGARVQLNDPTTWPEPVWRTTTTNARRERVDLCGWTDWRRRGLAAQPVQLVQVLVRTAAGQPKYTQPL